MSTIIENDLTHNNLEDWLHQRKTYKVPIDLNQQNAIGIRLLIQQWQGSENFAGGLTMPCTRQTLDEIIRVLHLPRSYPVDIATSQYVPSRLQRAATSTGAKFGTRFYPVPLAVCSYLIFRHCMPES